MRTIILLSDFRSGSTPLLHAMKQHPQIGAPHSNEISRIKYGDVFDWEMLYWSYGHTAVRGYPADFLRRMQISNPYLSFRLEELIPYTEEKLFELWDLIVRRHGPIVFEKSPQYLESSGAIDLILKYKEWGEGRDVRLLSLIRDPVDCIPAQVLKRADKSMRSFKEIEYRWREKYGRLKRLRKKVPVLHMTYNDLVYETRRTFESIFEFCGLYREYSCFRHIAPTDIGAYKGEHDWVPEPETLRMYESLC